MNIRQESLSNFFQINVNSAKLSALFEKLIDTVDGQQHRIKSIIDRFNNNAEDTDNKFRKLQTFFNERMGLIIQTINEQKHKNKLISDQMQRQYTKNFGSVEKQLKITKQQIANLQFKYVNNQTSINMLKKEIFGQIYDDDKVKEQDQQKESAIEFKAETKQQLTMKKPLKQQMDEIRQYLKLSETKTNDQLKTLSKTIKFLQEQQLEEDKLSGQQFSLIKKNFKSSKKKKKLQDSTLQFAIFANRLDKIQDIIKEERQKPENKVLYPRTPGKKAGVRSPSRLCTTMQGQYGFNNLNQIEKSHQKLFNSEFINMRLLKMDERLKILEDSLKKDVDVFKNKSIVNEQKIGFLSRKIDKYHLENNQIQNNIRTIRQSQLDDKALEIIKNQMKKMMKDSDNALGSKLDRDQFIKDRNKVYEKITLTNQSIVDKADKEQVKKALMFFQDKIKEIILLIADQQNNQKSGALSRVPFKCLSCDKNLQFDEAPKKLAESSSKKGIKTLRVMTQKIKKRMRMNIPATITQPDSD